MFDMPFAVDAFRFYVGEKEWRRSSIWRVWTHADSVYATARSFGGAIKLSLHGGGVCQMGFTDEFWRDGITRNEFQGPRLSAARWKRAIPRDGQIVDAAILQFPTDFLGNARPVEQPRKGKKQFYLEPAKPSHCVEIGLFIGRAAVPDGEYIIQGWQNICKDKLRNGEVTIIAGRHAHFEKGFLPNLADISGKQPMWCSNALDALAAGETLEDLNMCLHSDPKAGESIRICEINGVTLRKQA